LKGATEGMVSMRFCEPVVSSLVKALTGALPAEVDSDCLDALGEIANMVVGNAKREFPLGGTSISTPKVGMSDPMVMPPVLVMPFRCSAGRFLVEFRLMTGGQTEPAPQFTDPDLEKAADAVLQGEPWEKNAEFHSVEAISDDSEQ
jgi:hypothetical protein